MVSREGPPLKIDVDRSTGRMAISWVGGTTQEIALEDLRRLCPCAVCAGLREAAAGGSELHMMTPTEATATAEIARITPVGRYAIQIAWADGHDTGIYTYGFLRDLGGGEA